MKDSRIFIPEGSRACLAHRKIDDWTVVPQYSDFSKAQIENMVDLLRESAPRPTQNMLQSERNVKCDTGLNEEQFEILQSLVPSLLEKHNYNATSARNSLYMYLMRLRKGHTYEFIGNFFGVTRVTVSKNIDKVRNVLKNEFVPLELGFDNLSREYLLQNSTHIARSLYCNGDTSKLITVWDATYIYCEKSANYDFQKLTYNSHKKRNYVKPMLCVTTNGKIVDLVGPFKATDNDATIMKKIFEKENDSIFRVFQPNDVVLVDRGFRDSVKFLKDRKLEVWMPSCADKKDANQSLTIDQANHSRFVTKCRYVVETRNGHLKTIWAVFSKTWSTISLPHLMDDLRIGAALINRFTNILVADKDDEEFIATEFHRKKHEPTILAPKVYSSAFQSHVKEFTVIDENNFDFPKLEFMDLKRIALGSYQIKQARSYIVKHIGDNLERKFVSYKCPPDTLHSFFGQVIADKHISDPVLTLTCMQSRFFGSKTRRVYILANPNENSANGIVSYCCDCKSGNRNVGCCAHVMTVIKFFGFSRHNRNEKPVAEYLDAFFYESVDEEDESMV